MKKYGFALLLCLGCAQESGSGLDIQGTSEDAGAPFDAGVVDVGPLDMGQSDEGVLDLGPAELMQSWTISSGIIINGADISQSARSAIVRSGTQGGLVVSLTDIEDYCQAFQQMMCPDGGDFLLTMAFEDISERDYVVGTELSATLGDVTTSCRGAGLGFDSGSATLSSVALETGGGVQMDFSITQGFTGQSVSGTIVAPYCNAVP